MSLILIHGEQTHLSRQKLIDVVQQAKSVGTEVLTLSAKNLTTSELETQLGSESLFGNSRLLVIEELHSLPVSEKRKHLINLLKNTTTDLLLWEKRSLTKPQIKVLQPKQEYEFKPTSAVFKWLDSFSPKPQSKATQLKLLRGAIASDGAELCFILLIRQVRLLIQAKTGAPIGGAPFMITKLKSQAQAFTLAQLLKVHHQLLKLDLIYKTSRPPWSLSEELDILLVRL